MKFMILSDVHGNIIALKECLKFVDNSNIDAIIWCGDYVTDYPGSHEVVQTIKSYAEMYKSYIVKGNREKNVIDYAKGKRFNIKQIGNLEYTYKLLTEEDLEWLESLPETIEAELDNNRRIQISHECTYENIDNCEYKIFGHSHRQCNFVKDNVKYINPGSVGITADEHVGAEFAILEIKDDDEIIENHLVQYNIDGLLQELKKTPIYNDEVKWGRLLEKSLKTGFDYPLKCIEEYEKIRNEQHLKEESLEVWNIVRERVLNLKEIK